MNRLAVSYRYQRVTLEDNPQTLLVGILYFIWVHRFTFLTLAENINNLFLLGRATWQGYISLFEIPFYFIELRYLPG